jgi:hypothetical protein
LVKAGETAAASLDVEEEQYRLIEVNRKFKGAYRAAGNRVSMKLLITNDVNPSHRIYVFAPGV